MAKVSDGRGQRKPSIPLKPAEIRRLYADPLGSLAVRLHEVARQMDEAGIATIKPIPGGIETTLARLDEIIAREFEGKMQRQVKKIARRMHRIEEIRQRRTDETA